MMGLDAIPTTSKLVAAPRIKPIELTECFGHSSLLYDCLGMPDTSLSYPQLSQQPDKTYTATRCLTCQVNLEQTGDKSAATKCQHQVS